MPNPVINRLANGYWPDLPHNGCELLADRPREPKQLVSSAVRTGEGDFTAL